MIQDGDLFICPKCFKSFAIRDFCILHIKRHTREVKRKRQLGDEPAEEGGMAEKDRILKCPECYKQFKSKASFERHSSVHREAKLGLYRCKICGMDNESNYELTNHSLKVHGKFQMAPALTKSTKSETISRKKKPAVEIKKLIMK
uniref:(northern house mosquito) hypothetical protein n=2 Tax=Culex pipiens TaxID=7175 RepID=A0A8D8FH42_CULPI